MSYWLGTVSGKKIDLTSPDPDQIIVEDIAHALFKIPRFNGHIEEQWSVGHHSLGVATLVSDQYKLEALLHDATEAYLCDIPSPLKWFLGDAYREVEIRIARAIGLRFSVDLVDLPEQIKIADSIMLMTEYERLQPSGPKWGTDYSNGMRAETVIDTYQHVGYAKDTFIRAVKQEAAKRGDTIAF